jgi:SAM-dependent methyltransferase
MEKRLGNIDIKRGDMMIYLLVITNIITLVCLLVVSLHYEVPLKLMAPSRSRQRFLKKINRTGRLLDVGCGNNSPYAIKTSYPDIDYTGIDIGDYNQTKPNLADHYIVTTPEKFADTIASMANTFDTVISAHNLEHCNDREKTLEAMLQALKPGGYLYLSFPTENSVNFLSRASHLSTLNYYDDPTHKGVPPDYNKTIETIKKNDFEIMFSSKSYKPFWWHLIGFLQERKSKVENKVNQHIWAYWGFETIIWARKKI